MNKTRTNLNNFYKIPLSERETIIHIDYSSGTFNFYTTRVATMKKTLRKIGEPKRIEKIEDKICSMEWEILAFDRGIIRKALSLSNILPIKKNKKD